MGWTIVGLITIFIAWNSASMWVLYRYLMLHREYSVPLVPPRLRHAMLPWWNWKHFTWGFILRIATLAVLHAGLTVFCLWLAWLVI